MSSPYFWSGCATLLIMFMAVLNVLLDIRNELRRMNNRAEVDKRAAHFERQRREL